MLEASVYLSARPPVRLDSCRRINSTRLGGRPTDVRARPHLHRNDPMTTTSTIIHPAKRNAVLCCAAQRSAPSKRKAVYSWPTDSWATLAKDSQNEWIHELSMHRTRIDYGIKIGRVRECKHSVLLVLSVLVVDRLRGWNEIIHVTTYLRQRVMSCRTVVCIDTADLE